MSKLILVGAGPGDDKLITLKGVEALQEADVILYDALANETLLEHARPECKKVFVGKRAGYHHYQQFMINKMIVDYAKTHGTVVRMKGGDPYVFGRGHEEAEYAERHGILTEIVPGVSSALAVPALQNIPLTKRGISESFWVLTGTLKDGSLSKDMPLAAQSSASVIILMGMKKLTTILDFFHIYRSADEPVAIIQNGSTADEKMVIGTVADIAIKVKEDGIAAPSIIVIGAVVNQRNALKNLHNNKNDINIAT